MAVGIEVGGSYVTILPSGREFGPRLRDMVDRETDDAGRRGGRRFSSSLAGGLATGAKVVAGGLAIGTAAVTGFAAGASYLSGFASDAEQSLGATSSVFKDYADQVTARSDEAASRVGLSANAYRELANVVGSQLKNLGTPMDQLSAGTDDLITKAADMAATFGGSTEDATAAIASMMRGEYDPIERYGISIKESLVTETAAALAGVSKNAFKDLDRSAQNAFRGEAITGLLDKQTVDLTGAFARETGTLAHQQQVLGAQTENLKSSLGSWFLPMMTEGARSLNDTVIPAIQGFIDQAKAGTGAPGAIADTVGRLWDAFQTGKDVLTDFATDAAPYVQSFMQDIWPDVQRLGTQGAGMLATFGETASRIWTQDVRPFLDQLWQIVQTQVLPVLQDLQAKALPIFDAIGTFAMRTWNEFLRPVFERLSVFVRETVGPTLLWLYREVAAPVFGMVGQLVGSVWENVLGPVFNLISTTLLDTVFPALLGLWDTAQPVIEGIGTLLGWVWETILRPSLGWLVDFISGSILPAFGWLIDGATTAIGGIGDVIGWVWTNVIDPALTWLGDTLGAIPGWFTTVKDNVATAWGAMKDAITQPFMDAYQWLIDKFFGPLNAGLDKIGLGHLKVTLPGMDTGPVTPPVSASGNSSPMLTTTAGDPFAPAPIPGLDPMPAGPGRGDVYITGIDTNNIGAVTEAIADADRQKRAAAYTRGG